MKQAKRNSSIELLRIISIYLIVFIHAGPYQGYLMEESMSRIYGSMAIGICNIGVTCFVLISGYFGLEFKFKKLLKMECMMIGYSLIETVILCILMPEEMRGAVLLEQLVKSVLPFITRKYWFYSTYLCLYCLSGYINRFVNSLEKEEFNKLLGMMLLLFSIFPTFFYFEIVPDNGKGLVQMTMIYMIGRYIHRYGFYNISKRIKVIIFIGLWIINGVSYAFPIHVSIIKHHLCKDNSITNIVMAIILFSLIKEWNYQSNVINKLASYVFAVFALNNSMISAVIPAIGNCGKLQGGGFRAFVLMVIVVAVIIIICLLIGMIRELLFGKIENVLIDKVQASFNN